MRIRAVVPRVWSVGLSGAGSGVGGAGFELRARAVNFPAGQL